MYAPPPRSVLSRVLIRGFEMFRGRRIFNVIFSDDQGQDQDLGIPGLGLGLAL